MKWLWPKTLTSQTIIVLVVGLTVSHFLSMLIYSGDRIETLTMLGGRNIAQRIANVSHLIDETPIEWRQRIVDSVSDPSFRVALTPESMLVSGENESAQGRAFGTFLDSQLHGDGQREIRIQLLETDEHRAQPLHDDMGSWMRLHMMRVVHGMHLHQAIRVSIKLEDRSWLNFSSSIPDSPSLWSSPSLLSMGAMATAVIFLSVWVVRRLSSPLRGFAMAAHRLGRDVNAPSLNENGPNEVRDAARAFNGMQAQLVGMIEHRKRMLAAISHDLRTPITLLKLRTESLPESHDKERMLATLDDMEQIISSTLTFSRQDAEIEDRRTVDLVAMLDAICEDLQDAGQMVLFEDPGKRVRYDCQQVALKRAVTNLIDNAVKFGSTADVSIEQNQDWIEIVVEDDGPGIDPSKLNDVFMPFIRGDDARSEENGGVGLGLSIAQTIAQNHGGDITLENKPDHGMRAILKLAR
jgi:signal transduction histidine kinase